jgi:phospholipase/carboxylesterase
MLHTELVAAREPGSKDLLVVLHGLGDSMEGYRWVPEMLGTPSLNVLFVNAPDVYYTGFAWYDLPLDFMPGAAVLPTSGGEAVERSYGLLEKLLDTWRAKGYPTERTVLFGFSQGCLMSVETGIRYPHRLAGIIGVSGYVHDPDRLLKMASPVAKEQRFLITHGTDDPLIPFEAARKQFEQLKAAGMQIEFHSYRKVHTIIEPEFELFRKFLEERLGKKN